MLFFKFKKSHCCLMQHIIEVKKPLLIISKYLFDSIFYNFLNQLSTFPGALYSDIFFKQFIVKI